MTASHILFNASSYSAEHTDEMRSRSSHGVVANERGHSSEKSPNEPEQDFRETFRQHLRTSSDAPQSTKRAGESSTANAQQSAASARQKEPATVQAGVSTGRNPKQPAAPAEADTTGKPKQVANGVAPVLRPAVKTQKSDGTEQPRKATDGEQADSTDSQVAAIPVSASEQAVFQNGLDGGDQAATSDEYAPPASGSDNTPDALPLVSATGPANGDLALAMRIGTPGIAGTETQRPAAPAATPGVLTASASLLRGSTNVPSNETEQRHEGSVDAVTGTAAAMDGSSASPQSEKAGRVTGSEQTNPADFEAELAKYRNEPVRGAHVQIDGSGNQRVDIRLLERGGALSVSVRSADMTLTRALQDHSTELNARLATEHFQTELWKPDLSKQPSNRTSENEHGQPQGGSSGDGSPDQRQQGKRDREPAWFEDFENHATALNKRIEYTWHL